MPGLKIFCRVCSKERPAYKLSSAGETGRLRWVNRCSYCGTMHECLPPKTPEARRQERAAERGGQLKLW